MVDQTNTANNNDWRRASKGVSIRAYVEATVSTHVEGERPPERGDLKEALRTVGRQAKPS